MVRELTLSEDYYFDFVTEEELDKMPLDVPIVFIKDVNAACYYKSPEYGPLVLTYDYIANYLRKNETLQELKEFCFVEATMTTKKYLLQILENDADNLVIPNLLEHFKECDWIKCVPTHAILYLDILKDIAKEAESSLWLFPITKDKMFIFRKGDQEKYFEYEKNYKALIDTMSKDEILSQSILEYNVLEDRIIYAFDEFNHSGIGFDEYDS